jgi:hypothetical protein
MLCNYRYEEKCIKTPLCNYILAVKCSKTPLCKYILAVKCYGEGLCKSLYAEKCYFGVIRNYTEGIIRTFWQRGGSLKFKVQSLGLSAIERKGRL